jgi:hypothetical protein
MMVGRGGIAGERGGIIADRREVIRKRDTIVGTIGGIQTAGGLCGKPRYDRKEGIEGEQ